MTRDQYQAYLAGREWRSIRSEVMRRAKGKCRDCRVAMLLGYSVTIADAVHVHHTTYARIGRELPEDLVALCEDHHRLRHGFATKADADRIAGQALLAALARRTAA